MSTRFRNLADARELDIFRTLARLAFNVSREDREFWESEAPFTTENSWGLFDEAGTLVSALRVVDGGALYYRGKEPVPAALIGSVVTPPEHRRKGYTREMFAALFATQRERGTPLTALYPFYFPFYRSFGYELAQDGALHTVKIEQFKPWRQVAAGGRFVPASFPQDLETLNAIYDLRAQRGMGYVARHRQWWFWRMTFKRAYIPAYIYLDPDGRPVGYITYHFEDKEDHQREMVVRDMGAADRHAQEALYGFIHNHDSQASKVRIWLPSDARLISQIADPEAAEVRLHPGSMLRLLDVAEAFRRRTFVPEAEGEFSFALADEMVSENTGTYRIRVRDGRAEVERLGKGSEESAGLAMDSRALAQMYAGYIAPVDAAALGRLTVHREADLRGMQAVLSPSGQPRPFMADFF